jgi:prevent-host-death family protein
MKTVMNVAEAKAKLSELLERAERGEEVVIARAGKEIVRVVSVNPTLIAKPNRANFFGVLEHLGPVPAAALEPEPSDAWFSEQPIEGIQNLMSKVAETAPTFDRES